MMEKDARLWSNVKMVNACYGVKWLVVNLIILTSKIICSCRQYYNQLIFSYI